MLRTYVSLLLACCASAAVAQQPALPLPERLVYERGIEWGEYHPQTSFVLEKQADGSYLATVGGEDHPAQSGVVIPAERLLALRTQLADMQTFPDEGFGYTGNHWYTKLVANGTDASGAPFTLDRFFFDTNERALDARAEKFGQAVADLIKGKQAAPQITRFVYERGIEWSGDHAQLRLELSRQADGSYRATVGGEKHTALNNVPVSAAQLSELNAALANLRGNGGDSNAGDGNHWYTRYTLEGTECNGTAFTASADAYDPSSAAGMREVSALEGVVARLAKSLVPTPAAAPASGLAGALGH